MDGAAFSLEDVKLLIALTDGMRYAYFCDKVRCIQLMVKMRRMKHARLQLRYAVVCELG